MRDHTQHDAQKGRVKARVWKADPVVVVLLALFVGIPEEAKGYTDPGTGALIWQSLVAVLAVAAYYFRRVFGFFRRKDGSGD